MSWSFITDNPTQFIYTVLWGIVIVLISYGLAKRSAWSVGLAFGATTLSALRIFRNTLNGVPIDYPNLLRCLTAYSALISLVLTVMLIPSLTTKKWIQIFRIIGILNAVAILVGAIFKVPYGLLLTESMSACFSAVLLPLYEPKDWFSKGLLIASIGVAGFDGRSQPIALFFIVLGAFLLLQKRYKLVAAAVIASLIVGFVLRGTHLFEERGRAQVWFNAFGFLEDKSNYWTGTGLGSFWVIGPSLNPGGQEAFTWMHSDWIQTIFEQGFLGFFAVLIMYVHGLIRSVRTPVLFLSLVGYGAFAIANMPLRFPLAGFYGAVLVRWALAEPEQVK